MTNHTRGEHPVGALLFLQELTQAVIAGDVIEIGRDIWAIHGDIPVDREVIMAQFDTYDEARIALDAFFDRGRGPDLLSQPGHGSP
jgi:hypothetical protein